MIEKLIGKRYYTASMMVVRIEGVVTYGEKDNISYPLIRDYFNKKVVKLWNETYKATTFILVKEFENDFKLFIEIND